MKTMDRLYERLTPAERFQIAVAAFGRGDLAEVDRLNDSTPWRTIRTQEPAYFGRLQRISWLALYCSVRARDQLSATLAVFAAMVLQTLKTEGQNDRDTDEDDPKFGALLDQCVALVSRLKALHAAWQEFCTGLGVSASDTDKMIGLPFLGGGEALDLIEQVVGEVAPDEEYRQQCHDHMTRAWNTTICARYP